MPFPKDKIRVNEQIRCSSVTVIHEGKNIGIYVPYEACKLAKSLELDLVEIDGKAKPPVCRIMDFGKFRYEQGRKDREKRKHKKSSEQKELHLSPCIGDHDLQVKINSARGFLEKGNRVFFRLKYERRQNAHKDLGFKVIEKITSQLADIATLSNKPNLDGNCLNCTFEPK